MFGTTLAAGYWLVFGLLAAWGLYAVLVAGPSARASAAERYARIIAEDDRTFCAKFGIQTDTKQFAECSKQLEVIREKASKRTMQDGQGLI
jgi:hypothetical protein